MRDDFFFRRKWIHYIKKSFFPTLSKAVNNYENILLMGNLNINTKTQAKIDNTANHLMDFSDIFAFKFSKHQKLAHRVCAVFLLT